MLLAADERAETRGTATGVHQVDRQTVRCKHALLLRPEQRFDRVGPDRQNAQRLQCLRAGRHRVQHRRQRHGGREPYKTAAIEARHHRPGFPRTIENSATCRLRAKQ
jgi:hypothetical protein